MNYLEAALKILEEYSRPLTYQQLTAIALERNWIEAQANDPPGIMNLLIMQDLKTKGVRSEFSRIGPGTYAVRKQVYKAVPESEEPAPPSRRGGPVGEEDGRGNKPGMNEAPPRPRRHLGGKDQRQGAPNAPHRVRAHSAEGRPREGRLHEARPHERRPHEARSHEARPHERRPHSAPHPEEPQQVPEPARPATIPAAIPASTPTAMPTVPSNEELWQLMEGLGTGMGYRIESVVLSEPRITCMGWHIGGNPEISFILWVHEGIDMGAGIRQLLDRNYHKAVLMAEEGDQAAAEAFLADFPLKDKVDLIPLGVLLLQAQAGIRYMEFYNRLCDCRPLRERKSFTIV